jgi:UDP-glucose 4-epimerase
LVGDLRENFVALNIGTGTSTDVNELAAEVQRQCQKVWESAGRQGTIPAPRHGPDRPGDLRSNLLSARRARQVLNWEPSVSLAEGLRQTVAWFAERAGVGP